MPKQVSLAHARQHLPSLLNRVEAGSEVELTRRGKPIAWLISTREYQRLHTPRSSFRAAWQTFLALHRPSTVALSRPFLKALRATGPGRRVAL